MGAVAVALAGFFAFVILRFTAPTMVPLFTELDERDAAAILQELDRLAIPYELGRNGSTILAPEGDVPRLRMDLAADGLPSGGGVGYEIFDQSGGLGTTSFVQNINRVRALEGELTRTIQSLDRVGAARVHLNLPERELFAREQQQPSASIVVRTRGELEAAQVRAIRHLVASAVKGMRPDRVSIVDDTGRLLADGAGGDDLFAASAMDERRVELEGRIRTHVEELVASVVGRDRMRVQVAAELDHSSVTTTSDRFDPDGRVVRSSQTREESSDSRSATNEGVSVGNELPAAGQTAGGGDREASTATEEVINYEISRTSQTETREAGRLSRISVAVVVDGTYEQDSNGDIVYRPRPEDELERIASLVRSAVGFSETRGDRVEVANLRFAEPPSAKLVDTQEDWLPDLTRSDMLRLVETAVLGLVGILVVLFVARPLVRRILTPEAPSPAASEAAPALTDQSSPPAQLAAPAPAPEMPSKAIEEAEIAGEIQSATVAKISNMIESNRGEAAMIIRNWIGEPA